MVTAPLDMEKWDAEQLLGIYTNDYFREEDFITDII